MRTLHDRSEAYRRVADYFSIELSQGHQVVGVFSAMFAVTWEGRGMPQVKFAFFDDARFAHCYIKKS